MAGDTYSRKAFLLVLTTFFRIILLVVLQKSFGYQIFSFLKQSGSSLSIVPRFYVDRYSHESYWGFRRRVECVEGGIWAAHSYPLPTSQVTIPTLHLSFPQSSNFILHFSLLTDDFPKPSAENCSFS
jgi:hypothetical protein